MSKKRATKHKRAELNPKQKRFCLEYIKDSNGTQSAIRAGYSKKTANEQAAQLLAKLSIQNRIKDLQDKLAAKIGVTQEMLLNEYKKVAFSNISDFIASGNEIKDLSTLNVNVLAAVESVQSDIRHDGGDKEGYTEKVKLKLHSKLSALNDLGKHLGFFAENNKQIADGFAQFLKEMQGAGIGLPIKS